MTTPKTNKPVMAELLVRHVFGEAENFERLCAQRGVTVDQAVQQALREWVGHGLTVVKSPPALMHPTIGRIPDPADCPQGQEQHWIGVCEHDLAVLRKTQEQCFRSKDTAGVASTAMTIEAYIQTLASLKERIVA